MSRSSKVPFAKSSLENTVNPKGCCNDSCMGPGSQPIMALGTFDDLTIGVKLFKQNRMIVEEIFTFIEKKSIICYVIYEKNS